MTRYVTKLIDLLAVTELVEVSLTPSSVVATQQLDSGVKLLDRPHSSRRQADAVAGVSRGAR